MENQYRDIKVCLSGFIRWKHLLLVGLVILLVFGSAGVRAIVGTTCVAGLITYVGMWLITKKF
jgi:hypothetical protein